MARCIHVILTGLLGWCTSASGLTIANTYVAFDADPWLSDQSLYASPATRDRIGRIIVPVWVNGQGPFRFVVDTGANKSLLSPALIEKLALPLSVERPINVNGVTGSAVAPAVLIHSLEAGAMRLMDRRLPVLGGMMTDVDGVLGVDGLKGKRIVIDFATHYVEITESSGKRAPPEFLVVPAKLRFGQLLVTRARVGKVKVKAVIDTGAQATLGNTRLQEVLGIGAGSRVSTVPTTVEGVTSLQQPAEMAAAPDIAFGNSVLTNVIVTFGEIYVFKLWGLDREPAIIVGMDVLGTLNQLVIDYRRREVQMLPSRAVRTSRQP